MLYKFDRLFISSLVLNLFFPQSDNLLPYRPRLQERPRRLPGDEGQLEHVPQGSAEMFRARRRTLPLRRGPERGVPASREGPCGYVHYTRVSTTVFIKLSSLFSLKGYTEAEECTLVPLLFAKALFFKLIINLLLSTRHKSILRAATDKFLFTLQ